MNKVMTNFRNEMVKKIVFLIAFCRGFCKESAISRLEEPAEERNPLSVQQEES